MLTNLIIKKTVKTDEKDAEIKALREQLSVLQKKTNIDLVSIGTEKTRQENTDRLQTALLEEQRLRIEEDTRRKAERVRFIERTMNDQIGVGIKIFRIISDDNGRRADYYQKVPITCPSCGLEDIPAIPELYSSIVERYEKINADPVYLIENPQLAVGSVELHCQACSARFRIHSLVCL